MELVSLLPSPTAAQGSEWGISKAPPSHPHELNEPRPFKLLFAPGNQAPKLRLGLRVVKVVWCRFRLEICLNVALGVSWGYGIGYLSPRTVAVAENDADDFVRRRVVRAGEGRCWSGVHVFRESCGRTCVVDAGIWNGEKNETQQTQDTTFNKYCLVNTGRVVHASACHQLNKSGLGKAQHLYIAPRHTIPATYH